MRESIPNMIPKDRMRMGDTFADLASACPRSDFATGKAGLRESSRGCLFICSQIVRGLLPINAHSVSMVFKVIVK